MRFIKIAPLVASVVISSTFAGINYESSNLESSFFGGIHYGFKTSGATRSAALGDLDEDAFPGFVAGYNDTNFRYYLSYDPLDFEGGSVKNLSANIDYLYALPTFSRWHLYAGLNGGQNRFKDDTLGSDNVMSYGGQAGVIFRFSENTNFEFGYKHIDANGAEAVNGAQKSELEDVSGFRAGVTFNFPLAKKAEAKPEPVKETPPPVPERPKVVELDSDKDGVLDKNDKCPNTPKGFQVDDVGCEVSFEFMVNFAYDSAKLDKNSLSSVVEFADFLKKNPLYFATIEGHTDSRGTNKYNQVLSEKRAKAVMDKLLELGIDKKRLEHIGYGEEKPRVANDTEENMLKNRRVEAKLIIK